MTHEPGNIFLVGPRACGKTSLGRALARRLGVPFLDTDHLLAAHVGRPIAELVADQGWDSFRRLESEVLRTVQSTPGQIVATGGGIVLRVENRELLSTGTVVYLRADPATLAARLAADPEPGQRPSLTGLGLVEEVVQVLAEREPVYLAAADLVLDASRPLADLAEDVLRFLDSRRT